MEDFQEVAVVVAFYHQHIQCNISTYLNMQMAAPRDIIAKSKL